MSEHLVYGQNAPYVEVLKDQKTPLTDFQAVETGTKVIMGAPDEKDIKARKIPEVEHSKVIQLDDVPKAGKNQKAAQTTTEVTVNDNTPPTATGTVEKTPEEIQAEQEAAEKAKAELMQARMDALAPFELTEEEVAELKIEEMAEDEFNALVAEKQKELDDKAGQNTPPTAPKSNKSK